MPKRETYSLDSWTLTRDLFPLSSPRCAGKGAIFPCPPSLAERTCTILPPEEVARGLAEGNNFASSTCARPNENRSRALSRRLSTSRLSEFRSGRNSRIRRGRRVVFACRSGKPLGHGLSLIAQAAGLPYDAHPCRRHESVEGARFCPRADGAPQAEQLFRGRRPGHRACPPLQCFHGDFRCAY